MGEIIDRKQNLKKRSIFLCVILVPIFLFVSLSSSRIYNGHKRDFAVYWQGAYMVLHDQDVYDSAGWISERESLGTALHSEPTFNYPLPLAVLFMPFALLSVQSSYIFWLFFAQVAILISPVILLSFYLARSGYVELLTMAGVFLFRPTFSVILNGQITSLLLLVISISILLFHRKNWFLGGCILTILSLKPSIGLPILALAGVWLLFGKQWMGILGMVLGCLVLFIIGYAVDPYWAVDYLAIGGDAFNKYYGMQSTVWGIAAKILPARDLSVIIGVLAVLVILSIELYLLFRNPLSKPFEAMASIVPAGLLIAPHSWAYNQLLLAVSIVYLVIRISNAQGVKTASLFIFGVVLLAVLLVSIAYLVNHDVWSVLNSFVVWVLVLHFTSRSNLFAEGTR